MDNIVIVISIVSVIVGVIAIANTWLLVTHSRKHKQNDELLKAATKASKDVAVINTEITTIKKDIVGMKSDVLQLTQTMIDSVNKLDARLYDFIVAQATGTKK